MTLENAVNGALPTVRQFIEKFSQSKTQSSPREKAPGLTSSLQRRFKIRASG
jgi:hypothetical protein